VAGLPQSSLAAITTSTVGVPDLSPTRGFGAVRVFPNPARGSAQVEFVLANADRVLLTIVDVHGREIARLGDGPFSAGPHHVSWSVPAGRVPPGVYWVRCQAGGRIGAQR